MSLCSGRHCSQLSSQPASQPGRQLRQEPLSGATLVQVSVLLSLPLSGVLKDFLKRSERLFIPISPFLKKDLDFLSLSDHPTGVSYGNSVKNQNPIFKPQAPQRSPACPWN